MKIKGILRDKLKEIARSCVDIDKDFDKNSIHNFRVTVKSLRSFLRLLRMYIHKPSLKMPKKFKRLYHIAGAIRDIQLEIETISNKQSVMPEYLDKLGRMLDQQKNEWRKYYSKKTIRKLEDKLTKPTYETLQPEILEKFFNDRTAAIGNTVQNSTPTDSQVHNVRKKIKDILYTAKLADKELHGFNKQTEKLPLKQLDKIAGNIGDYHDDRQMLEHLSIFSARSTEQNEKVAIKKFRSKEMRKLKAKKKNILTTIAQLPARSKNGQ